MVNGSDNTNWKAYVFAETGEADSIFEEEEETYDSSEIDDEGDEDVGPEVDYLASDVTGEVVLTEHIIQDPRKYWLHVVGLRLATAVNEWDDLIHQVGKSIHVWVFVLLLWDWHG